MTFPFNKVEHLLAKLTVDLVNDRRIMERRMQLFLMIELALMLLLVVKVGIRNAEQELLRTPLHYDDTD
jgi:hypothetical protein